MWPIIKNFLRFFVAGSFVFCAVRSACSETAWTPPTPDELAMTQEPRAPDASAIVLSYDEIDDANSAEVTIHVRLKVLTTGGLSAANVELPAEIVFNDDFDQDIFARTIHRDGIVVPYQRTPQNETTRNDGGSKRRFITLPDVQVGSILEFICHFRSQNTLLSQLINFYAPSWQVQQPYFVRSAHFRLVTPKDVDDQKKFVHWVPNLPAGVEPKWVKSDIVLDVQNVPAGEHEIWMPPSASVFYRVQFFYYAGTMNEFWGDRGGDVNDVWSQYDQPRKLLTEAVQQLIAPANTDEQKLRKIYAAVTAMENTDLTRERSDEENKRNGLHHANNADDIWTRKSASSDELALLFIAMARAAGYKAYPMAVTSRDQGVFDPNVLSWSQADSIVAIVDWNGGEFFFDPGTRFCPFGRLAPWHSNVLGVSIDGKIIKIRYTPKADVKYNQIQRVADIAVAADGSASGAVRIQWSGIAALSYRRRSVREDRSAVMKNMEQSLQSKVPAGIQIAVSTVEGLDDADSILTATFRVTGKLGTRTSKRLLLPAQFFESNAVPLLSAETRAWPVNFPKSHKITDVFRLHPPDGFEVEGLPPAQNLSLGEDASYQARASAGTDPEKKVPVMMTQRVYSLNRIDYPVVEYPELRSFFADVARDDQSQIVLRAQSGPETPNSQ